MKAIKDNADKLYLESQSYNVYDTYRVLICHHCQKYGHIATKCPEKNDNKLATCGKCAGAHETRNCKETQKKCINCVRRGINKDIDHKTTDRNCPMYETEKTSVQNNTDHGF